MIFNLYQLNKYACNNILNLQNGPYIRWCNWGQNTNNANGPSEEKEVLVIELHTTQFC